MRHSLRSAVIADVGRIQGFETRMVRLRWQVDWWQCRLSCRDAVVAGVRVSVGGCHEVARASKTETVATGHVSPTCANKFDLPTFAATRSPKAQP